MKKRKLIPALVLTLTLLCGITIGATASNGIQKIQADLDPTISVKYNGETQTMLDASGSRIYPITYQGTTYLPIRAVAGLAGLGVDWDQATRSVLLGDPAEGVDLIEAFKPYTKTGDTHMQQFAQNSDKKTANAGGVEISHWIGFWFEPFGNQAKTVSFNLGGKYTALTCQMYAAKDTKIVVKGDNDAVLGEYDLVGGQVPKTVEINLLSTTQLSFVCEEYKDFSECFIFDTVLK